MSNKWKNCSADLPFLLEFVSETSEESSSERGLRSNHFFKQRISVALHYIACFVLNSFISSKSILIDPLRGFLLHWLLLINAFYY